MDEMTEDEKREFLVWVSSPACEELVNAEVAAWFAGNHR